ncbi:DNA repair-scaffolding protein [Protopterus annectens]|uniref:DNA repair-scaffolding protein n=1 Tax=Protopterus annectens TaxID=7888 RepID=UPI001CFBA89D|nr:DNA repair-scaffolding protein [Protopterus annectens]
MFSEVQFQNYGLPEEGLEQYSKKWEGKCCCLLGMKVLQRTTRGRSPGLFSLIDSLWPPLIPLKVHGQSQDSQEIDGRVPAPSFCYILGACPDEKSVEMVEEPEPQVLDLYLPPVVHSLKTILQNVGSACRCSFNAQVIFKRLQVENGARCGTAVFSLYVTDPVLQNAAHHVPRVLQVVVTSSCILGADVVDAVRNALPCVIFFRDAVKETDKIICVERTVLSLQWSQQYSIDGVDFTQMTGPVKLDELDSTTNLNTLCTVKGTVVGVDEDAAFSWPECNRCGNGKLVESPGDTGLLYCRHCHQPVTEPVTKMELEVFLQCPWTQHPVKVKLHQETIASLLMSSNRDEGGYELECVLGKEVGPLSCYVRSLATHPSHKIGLDEIRLS